MSNLRDWFNLSLCTFVKPTLSRQSCVESLQQFHKRCAESFRVDENVHIYSLSLHTVFYLVWIFKKVCTEIKLFDLVRFDILSTKHFLHGLDQKVCTRFLPSSTIIQDCTMPCRPNPQWHWSSCNTSVIIHKLPNYYCSKTETDDGPTSSNSATTTVATQRAI